MFAVTVKNPSWITGFPPLLLTMEYHKRIGVNHRVILPTLWCQCSTRLIFVFEKLTLTAGARHDQDPNPGSHSD